MLYCVHRYFFSRDSTYFSTRFDQLDIHDHEPLSTIISLGDTERKDFDAFLSILYPKSVFWSIVHQLTYRGISTGRDFEGNHFSYEEWKSVLNLSTRWGFASIRRLAHCWHLALSSLRRLTIVSYLRALIQSTIGWFLRCPHCAKDRRLSPYLRLGR